jgi:hypothetical protein
MSGSLLHCVLRALWAHFTLATGDMTREGDLWGPARKQTELLAEGQIGAAFSWGQDWARRPKASESDSRRSPATPRSRKVLGRGSSLTGCRGPATENTTGPQAPCLSYDPRVGSDEPGPIPEAHRSRSWQSKTWLR